MRRRKETHSISERAEDGLSSYVLISISKFLTAIDDFQGGQALIDCFFCYFGVQCNRKNHNSSENIELGKGSNRTDPISDRNHYCRLERRRQNCRFFLWGRKDPVSSIPASSLVIVPQTSEMTSYRSPDSLTEPLTPYTSSFSL